MIIQGRLHNPGSIPYVGYQAVGSFTESLDLEDSGSRGHHAKASEPVWIASERRVPVSSDGTFALDLPSLDALRGPFRFQALAPDGEILASEDFPDLPREVILNATPKEYSPVASTGDPFLGKRVRLSGRVIDSAGKHQVAGAQVVVYAVPEAPPGGPPVPVIVSTTDARGYFFADYPVGNFASAYGVIGTGAGESITVPLKGNQFPRTIILVVKDVPEPSEKSEQ